MRGLKQLITLMEHIRHLTLPAPQSHGAPITQLRPLPTPLLTLLQIQ